MIQPVFVLLLLLFFPSLSFDDARPSSVGIRSSKNFTAEELVRDKFIRGQCQNVSNIEAIGNERSWGHFSGGSNVFGFDENFVPLIDFIPNDLV